MLIGQDGEDQSPKMDEVGTNLWVNLLQGVEEGLKGGATKVGDGAQAREQTPVQHLLEVPLTDVLAAERTEGEGQSQAEPGQLPAQMVTRPSCLAGRGVPAWWS